ncbi:ketopantoate reductase [Halomicrobium zhouii]|uniref:2-dehydropantoate 2-reductase n=1 Tax=Halomicrobium zhouii TaxID=767519 RepID=A0A1I6KDN0_9EURY|nr:ketopantoate reductase family protein [Halomicrobium zhouii]SFR89118.1 ketopantoate reductase [Halomicrobium zhouii]
MNVVVFGAGSLGSLVGGLLAREHDVTLVGRDPHVSAVREGGLRVSGAFEFTTSPSATTSVPDAADLAVVTVKAYDTPEAAAALVDCDLGSCLSLQNGMGNEATLAAQLECPVLAGTCTYGARLAEPGHVACTGVGEVALGPREGGSSTVADEVGVAFDDAGIETVVADDVHRRLWEKLAVNAGINATTALARVENGALVDGPGGDVAAASAREVARVAREQGVDLSDEPVVSRVASVAADTAANRSSMLQDVDSGSRTEVDAINGYVVDAAAGEAVPVNRTLTALVRAWERERGLR